ncbi:MAG TPA: glycosyltransferase [Candidatus Paceibacterota bacterium]
MLRQKILFIITKGNWGGAQRYVYDLATHLPKKIFEVVVAIGEGSLLSNRLVAAGIRTISLPNLGRDVEIMGDLKSFFTLWRLFRDEKPNIIHLNSSKAGALGALASRIYNLTAKNYALKARVIFTAHGWSFNEDRSRLARFAIAFLHWLTILLAHQTIVVAAAPRRQMVHWPLANRRMVVIKNGVSKINFLDRPNARLSLLGEEIATTRGSTWWLGTISELHHNKGLEYLIRAVKILLDTGRCQGDALTVVIIGEGEARPSLEKLIQELKLGQQIILLGRKDNAAQYLKAFDVFTLTSITEAFPYAILEAGVASLPVVASGVGGIPEMVRSMDSGILVKPRQPSEIAAALEFLLAHPAKTSQLGKCLHARVTKKFSTAHMVKETIAVYNNDHASKS